MSHDIVADGLSKIMNAKRARAQVITLSRYSRFLLSVLAIAKLKGYIKDYSIENKLLRVELKKLNMCGAIKPRFIVTVEDIEVFTKRYLPAKNIGVLIVSTSNGLMTHQTALEKKIGGALIAYFY